MKIIKVSVIIFSMFIVSQVSAQQSEAKLEKRAKNKFKKINTDGNDSISVEEWDSYYKDKKNKKGKLINSKFIFLGLDKNDDKNISLEEMLKGVDKDLAKSKMKALKKAKKKSKNN